MLPEFVFNFGEDKVLRDTLETLPADLLRLCLLAAEPGLLSRMIYCKLLRRLPPLGRFRSSFT